jgi:transcriptional regulator with XRE-family HTH domain
MPASTPEQDWMTPEEFKSWFVRLGLSQSELARRLEVKQPTISRWLNDTPGQGRSGDEGKGRRIEHGEMLRLALERLEQVLIEERNPKRRRRGVRSDQSTMEATDAG